MRKYSLQVRFCTSHMVLTTSHQFKENLIRVCCAKSAQYFIDILKVSNFCLMALSQPLAIIGFGTPSYVGVIKLFRYLRYFAGILTSPCCYCYGPCIVFTIYCYHNLSNVWLMKGWVPLRCLPWGTSKRNYLECIK